MLGIDQVNEAVERSRLTPAFVPPVATQVGKHAFEVAGGRNPGSVEGGLV